MSNNLTEEESAHVPAENMVNEELETLIVDFIQRFKDSNKKYGKDKVFDLVNISLKKEISREIFEILLYQLIEKKYGKLNVLEKRTCLSLPK